MKEEDAGAFTVKTGNLFQLQSLLKLGISDASGPHKKYMYSGERVKNIILCYIPAQHQNYASNESRYMVT